MDSQTYYSERRAELEADFNKKVANGLQKIFNTVGEIQNDLNEIQKKFQEIEQRKLAKEKDNAEPNTSKGAK
jgi:hypothetical protein